MFLLLFLFFLIGCSLPHDAADPLRYAPSTPDSVWRPLKENITMTSKFCDPLLFQNWKEKILSLADLIDITLQNNPLTKKTWADAKEAAAYYGQSLAAYFPDIEVAGTFESDRSGYSVGGAQIPSPSPGVQSSFTPETQLTYMIFDFGIRSSDTKKTFEALIQSNRTHNRQIQTVIQTIITAFYEYQYQKKNLEAQKMDLENAKATLDAATKKFGTGVASLSDVTQAKTAFLQTKLLLINEEKTIENSYDELMKNAGLPANLKLTFSSFPDEVAPQNLLTSVEELIVKAQSKREDYLALKANYASKEAEVNLNKSKRMPYIFGKFVTGKSFFFYDAEEDYHFSGLIYVTFPLFKGFFFQNAIKGARAKLSKAKAEIEEKELQIAREITTSHFNVHNAKEELSCSSDYLTEAERRFDIAAKSYDAGTATILDVIAAQSSLFDARAKKSLSVKNWFNSLADLAYAAGTLCQGEL